MTDEPLPGAHADEVRQIAEFEVRRFARLLAEEIARTPLRADGAFNARDLHRCMREAVKRYDNGEVAR